MAVLARRGRAVSSAGRAGRRRGAGDRRRLRSTAARPFVRAGPPVSARVAARGRRCRRPKAAAWQKSSSCSTGTCSVRRGRRCGSMPAQMRAFAPRLQALQQTRRRAVRQRQALLRELNDLTTPGAAGDDAALTAKLGALDQHDDDVRAAGARRLPAARADPHARPARPLAALRAAHGAPEAPAHRPCEGAGPGRGWSRDPETGATPADAPPTIPER